MHGLYVKLTELKDDVRLLTTTAEFAPGVQMGLSAMKIAEQSNETVQAMLQARSK